MVKVLVTSVLLIGISTSVLSKDFKTEVYYPETQNKPYPTIVISHGSAGVKPYLYEWINKFNRWGFATVLVDHFSNRGGLFRGRKGALVRKFDVDPVFKELNKNPKIDKNRISVIGFSAGESFVRNSIKYKKVKSAVLIYPSAFACYVPHKRIKIPLLIMHGTKDITLPCWRKLSYPNHRIYRDAYHGFDIPRFRTLFCKKVHKKFKELCFKYDVNVHQQSIEDTGMFLMENAK